MKVLRASITMLLMILVPLAIQLWDRRRQDDETRARGWNFATWGAALYALGPFSLLGWSWVTKEGWVRFVWGPAWLAVSVAFVAGVDFAVQLVAAEKLDTTLGDLALGAVVVYVLGVLVELWVAGVTWLWRAWKRRAEAGKARP
ncbi:MAG: hypothetical protein KC731_34940 [Myxococcales bacterium]|nr:hypothetical protein [Myxococcales bacterium]